MPAAAGNMDAPLLHWGKLSGSVAAPAGEERGRYGLVIKEQFRLGKAVVRKHHLRQMGES